MLRLPSERYDNQNQFLVSGSRFSGANYFLRQRMPSLVISTSSPAEVNSSRMASDDWKLRAWRAASISAIFFSMSASERPCVAGGAEQFLADIFLAAFGLRPFKNGFHLGRVVIPKNGEDFVELVEAPPAMARHHLSLFGRHRSSHWLCAPCRKWRPGPAQCSDHLPERRSCVRRFRGRAWNRRRRQGIVRWLSRS